MEYDLIVIGAGPGGYVAAIRAAQLGLKVACIDKRKEPGGTCLNVGCIPSKHLLHASHLYDAAKHHATSFGIHYDNLSFNFDEMIEGKKRTVEQFTSGIKYLFSKNGVDFHNGVATILSPTRVSIDLDGKQTTHQTKKILIASGSAPIELPFLPFDEKRILSSTGALALQSVPKRLTVIGAGVIGLELGSVYARLGSAVTVLEYMPDIIPEFDTSVKKQFLKLLKKQGFDFHLRAKATGADLSGQEITLNYEVDGKANSLTTDAILVAVGRRPYTKDLGLENLGIVTNERSQIAVAGDFQTAVSGVYAIGDVIDGPMLAHKAEEEGIVAVECMQGLKSTLSYPTIPSVIYTHPEVASVGLTEQACQTEGIEYLAAQFPFKANSRAGVIGEGEGFVKMIMQKKTRRLLGAHIIGPQAGELIQECVLALKEKLTVDALAHTPHAHPTLSEALKEAALALQDGPIHA